MKRAIIVLFGIVVASCQPKSKSSGITYEQLATSICKCAHPLVEYNDTLKLLADADEPSKLSAEMAKGDSVMKTTERCISDKIMTNIEDLLNSKLNQQVADQCNLDPRMIDDIVRKLEYFNTTTFQ